MKPAAAYYRMSSDSQEASIPAQREAVEKWAAANGWQIVVEYRDDGISGDDTARRAGFQQMLADAPKGRFEAIIVWDLARFGRFDSLEGGYWLFPLRQAGVQIVTLDRGVIDWSDFGGRVVWAVEQEGKNAFLRTLSRDVLRGKLKGARDGRWQGGRVPIGYSLGPAGRFEIDDASAARVRRIFAEYLGGRSLRSLARLLNGEGIRSPRGGMWSTPTVEMVLKNRVYLGEFRWNRENVGRYSRSKDGGVESKPAKRAGVNSPGEWIVFSDHHPAIVTAADFEAVQVLLARNKTRSTPKRDGGNFLFTGLVKCGHCGSSMGNYCCHGINYLICEGYMRKGAAFCRRRSFRESYLLDLVIAFLERLLTGEEIARQFRQQARRMERWKAGDATADRRDAIRSVESADAEIARLERRLCEVDPEFIPVIQQRLRAALEAKRDAETKLREIDRPAADAEREIAAVVTAAERLFRDLRAAIEKAGAREARALFQRLIDRIETQTDSEKWGKRIRSKLIRATLFFSADLSQLHSLTGRIGQVKGFELID